MQPTARLLKRRKLNDSSSGASDFHRFQQPLRSTKAQFSNPDDNGLVTASGELDNASASSPPADLQKEYGRLGRQLTSLRQNLDTAQQALLIQTNDQSTQIQALIVKWRQFIREAAEYLFEISKASASFQGETSVEQKLPYWQQEQLEAMSCEEREALALQLSESRCQAEKYGLLDTTEDAGTGLSSVSQLY
jgi:hypothetical protein